MGSIFSQSNNYCNGLPPQKIPLKLYIVCIAGYFAFKMQLCVCVKQVSGEEKYHTYVIAQKF